MITQDDFAFSVDFLKKLNSEEANRLVTKLEKMKDYSEFNTLNWELKILAMLDTFSKHF